MFTSQIALDWDNKIVMSSVKLTTMDGVEFHVSAYQRSVVLTLQSECHWKTHRFLVNNNERKSWENFLSNLTRLLIEEPCFDSRQIKKNYPLSETSTPTLRSTQSSIQRIPGNFSEGVERKGYENKYSAPPSVELQNAWAIFTSFHTT